MNGFAMLYLNGPNIRKLIDDENRRAERCA
jgi:hypothetical protein